MTTLAPARSVLEYNLVSYRRTWRGSVLSSFVLPVLFVLGFGIGVGSMVNTARLGESYLSFLVPGMIASTAMQVAIGEATYPVTSKFVWNKIYQSMVSAPLSVPHILLGDMAFVLFRVMTTAAVFLLVTALFGGVHSWWALAVIPLCGLIGIAFAAPMYAFAARVESSTNYFAFVQRFVIVPMSLFAGVFFTVSSLPVYVRPLAYVSPLWHGVELCRAATHTAHGSLLVALGHAAYLLLWAGVGLWLAFVSFRRRLSD
jgi:lipooligosaccharide transport system permease protein